MSSIFSEMYHLINLFFNSTARPTALNTECEGFIAAFKEHEFLLGQLSLMDREKNIVEFKK